MVKISTHIYSSVRILLGVLILPDSAGSSNIYIYIYILRHPAAGEIKKPLGIPFGPGRFGPTGILTGRPFGPEGALWAL